MSSGRGHFFGGLFPSKAFSVIYICDCPARGVTELPFWCVKRTITQVVCYIRIPLTTPIMESELPFLAVQAGTGNNNALTPPLISVGHNLGYDKGGYVTPMTLLCYTRARLYKGTSMVYLAGSLALTVLEVLAHLNSRFVCAVSSTPAREKLPHQSAPPGG